MYRCTLHVYIPTKQWPQIHNVKTTLQIEQDIRGTASKLTLTIGAVAKLPSNHVPVEHSIENLELIEPENPTLNYNTSLGIHICISTDLHSICLFLLLLLKKSCRYTTTAQRIDTSPFDFFLVDLPTESLNPIYSTGLTA